MTSRIKHIVVFLLISILSAQTFSIDINRYSSRKLEAIGKLLIDQYGISTSGDLSQLAIAEKKLILRYDNDRKLNQLGICLFTNQVKRTINDSVVTDFLERILLELILEEHNGKLNEKLKEYKIDLALNETSMGSRFFNSLSFGIKEINDSSRFTLTRDSLKYEARWRNSNQTSFSIRFPANYELILGKDKKELDTQLALELKHFSCSDNLTQGIDNISAMEKGKDFFTLKGKYLFLKDVNSNTYFESKGTEPVRWLYDSKFPAESFSNLFYHFDSRAASIQVKILHHKYGKETEEFVIPLARLICYFKKDFEIYIGFEKTESPAISAIVLLSNKKSSYFNMLWIKTDAASIFNGSAVVGAELFSYIPAHNIKNLFGESRYAGKLYPVKL